MANNKKNKDLNLEALGFGVILEPVLVKKSIENEAGIITKASHAKYEEVWEGEAVVRKVGPSVESLKEGDKVFVNLASRNRVPFEYKGQKLAWTLEPAIFAKILPESKIVT